VGEPQCHQITLTAAKEEAADKGKYESQQERIEQTKMTTADNSGHAIQAHSPFGCSDGKDKTKGIFVFEQTAVSLVCLGQSERYQHTSLQTRKKERYQHGSL
jgi:hypothetical protein